MDCVNCGLPAGYNRVVIDAVRDEQIGGFCRNCELDVFGHTLSKFTADDETCVLCNRDGLYALPAWKPYERATEDGITCAVEYTIHDRTPQLCDEHFNELCSGSEEQPAVQGRQSR